MTLRRTSPGIQRAIVSLAAALSFLAHPVGQDTRGVAPGDLDVTFGRNGVVTTDLGGNDWCFAVAVQTDHKLLCAGDTRNDNGLRDFALVRYKAAGGIDRSFGSRGTVTTDFGGDDWQRAVAIQADGRILGGGQADVGDRDFGLARHWPDGSSDPTFGSDGTVTTDFGAHDWVNALAIQADGKILAAGVTTQGEATSDVAVARYLQDGSLDPAFGSGGLAILDFGGGDVARSVAIQSDGKILIGGYTGSRLELSDDFLLARLDVHGDLDPSFGVGGVVVTDVGKNDIGRSLAIQPDGKVILAGFSSDDVASDFAVARYRTDGTLDPGFGTGGITTTDFGGWDEGRGVALQSDGRILVGGFTSLNDDFALARYAGNGDLDPAFGQGGKVTTDLGFDDAGDAVAIQFPGRLVVVGTTAMGTYTHDFALVRYLLTQRATRSSAVP